MTDRIMMQLASDDIVLESFAALDPGTVALLLDVDGTIVDIGPTPSQVHVPDNLCQSLERLARLTNGAVALVSGRLISDLDRMFSPLALAAVGAHGAELRVGDATVARRFEVLPSPMRARLREAARPGVLVEDKGYSVALHFRGAPEREAGLRELTAAVCRDFPDEAVDFLPGKAVIEVRRAEVNKGEGVLALMAHAPFRGRMPVFIGDDVTDEAVFAALPQIGGRGYSVSRKFSGAAGMFHSPQHVRDALARLASTGGGDR
ncbi:MAG: trehalose-phosphatase [Pseudolabrys sp.]|nr:trehalose-phosphatase [Pseudolabrys sp.]MBV9260599.1 trehalose-phosphatase [Pseudolabrys sp.]